MVDSRCEAWVGTYDNPNGYGEYGSDGARDMAADPEGGVAFVTGFSHDDDTGAWDIATVAFDAGTGSQRWAARYDGGGLFDDPAAITTSRDGSRVFVTGLVNADFNQNAGDFVTLAYDAATGTRLWASTFGDETSVDRPRDVAVDPSGAHVYVTGTTDPEGDDTHSDLVLLAYDAGDGSEEWSVTFDGPGGGNDTGQAISVSEDGSRVFVAGTGLGLGDPRDYDSDILVLSYEAADPERLGELLWATSYDGGILRSDGAADIGLSPDGSRMYVAGISERPGYSSSGYTNYDIATLAFDTVTVSGYGCLWHGPTEGINAVNDMEVTSNDRVIVAGHVSGSLTDRDWELGTAAYLGATGEELWKASTGFPRADFEMLNGVASSPDGATAYVTGFSRVQNRQDAVTLAYDVEAGTVAWTARYNHALTGTDFDAGEAIGVAGGRVITAASLNDDLAFYTHPGSSNFNYSDIGVLAYAP